MNNAQQLAYVEYIKNEADIWQALLETAKRTFELTPENRLYVIDDMDLDWNSVDCGHVVKNELAD